MECFHYKTGRVCNAQKPILCEATSRHSAAGYNPLMPSSLTAPLSQGPKGDRYETAVVKTPTSWACTGAERLLRVTAFPRRRRVRAGIATDGSWQSMKIQEAIDWWCKQWCKTRRYSSAGHSLCLPWQLHLGAIRGRRGIIDLSESINSYINGVDK